MTNFYRDTLESLENGTWTTFMRVHVSNIAKTGSKGAQNALQLGDVLWKRLWDSNFSKSRVKCLELEVNGLRDTIQQLTNTLLEVESKK